MNETALLYVLPLFYLLDGLMYALDNFKQIEDVDKGGMVKFLEGAPEHLTSALKLVKRADSLGLFKRLDGLKVENVIISGLGGSAISGDIILDWVWDRASLPITVSRGCRLPNFAGKKTLVVAVSYSGNTFETLAQLYEGKRRGCVLAGVSSGGKLREFCRKFEIPFFKLKGGMPPRAALPYLFLSTAYIISKVEPTVSLSEVEAIPEKLRRLKGEIGISSSFERNPAKKMAFALIGKYPMIYAFNDMQSVARRIKDQLNENSKVPAKFDLLPEACHNEIEGLRIPEPIKERVCFLLVREEGEKPIRRAMVEEFKKVLKTSGISEIYEIPAKGESKVEKIFHAIYFGDFVSFYLAIASKIDPTPIANIQKYKEGIKEEAERFIQGLSL